jgi:hypothetical protein
MAKKTKRSARKTMTLPASGTRPPEMQGVAPAARPAFTPRSTPAKVDLSQEYNYVFADLRKIAVIAVAMFVLLFVLAFVLK